MLKTEKYLSPHAPFSIYCVTFAPQNRDVAQLVAHYVRDVGVGRSSRLIPTSTKSESGESG